MPRELRGARVATNWVFPGVRKAPALLAGAAARPPEMSGLVAYECTVGEGLIPPPWPSAAGSLLAMGGRTPPSMLGGGGG